MTRLYMTVEGQTEQAFVSAVLVPHLATCGVYLAKARRTGMESRGGGRIPKGGMAKFAQPLRDMKYWLREQKSPDARFTMMVDLYDIPNDFPGYEKAAGLSDPYRRVEVLEKALADEMGDDRFIPYLQVHEFEALVLSKPEMFESLFDDSQKATEKLVEMCGRYKTPEQINEGQHTHPKARIQKLFPDYHENVDGPLLAHDIGLETMRKACPHFDQWLTTLEKLGSPTV